MKSLENLHPDIHFAGPWKEDEARAVVEAVERVSFLPGPLPSKLGKPWVLTKEPFETFAIYCASHIAMRGVLVAETISQLAALIQEERLRAPRSRLFQLIYSSRATRPFSDEDLRGLLRRARAKNEALNITGVLIHRQGRFAQLLEGDESVVRDLYATICEDDRHTDLVGHREEPVASRLFPNWWMGFEHARGIFDTDVGFLEMEEIQAHAKMRPVVEALGTLRRASRVG